MEKKYCALSFDDGPNTTTTVHMLEVLKKHNVKGSFFVIGQNINSETEKVMKMYADYGCDVENHSWTHSFMAEMPAEQIKDEIAKTTAKIEEVVGKTPTFFRPPYINISETMYKNIDLPFICGQGCEDWVLEIPADVRLNRMLEMAGNGSIFLLHDMEGNENTVEAVDKLIPILKERGFEFVTVPEIFEKCGVDPKREYALWANVMTDKPGKPGQLC